MFKQLITPNPDIPCAPGMCLKYVRETFGIKAVYNTATLAWNASKQHRDRNFPTLWLPIWFKLENPDGHVALLAPDKSVWSCSSATSNKPIHYTSIDAMIADYKRAGETLVYLGWSENVNNITVIKESEVTITDEEIIWNYKLIGGYTPSAKEVAAYHGKDYHLVTEDMKKYFSDRGAGYITYKDNANKEIAALKALAATEYIKLTDIYIKKEQ